MLFRGYEFLSTQFYEGQKHSDTSGIKIFCVSFKTFTFHQIRKANYPGFHLFLNMKQYDILDHFQFVSR